MRKGAGPRPEVLLLVQLTLAAGAAARLRIDLPPGAELRGQVCGSDGRPLGGATVLAHGVLRQEWAGVTTGRDGRFWLQGLNPARIVLEATAAGHRPQQIACRAGVDRDLAVRLDAGACYVGRLRGADGRPFGARGRRTRLARRGARRLRARGRSRSSWRPRRPSRAAVPRAARAVGRRA